MEDLTTNITIQQQMLKNKKQRNIGSNSKTEHFRKNAPRKKFKRK